MKRFIKSSLAVMVALYISCNITSAATPAELYDDVWKIVNKKFYDPTNNSQDWAKWRYRYDHKLKTPEDAYVAIDTMLASLNDPYTRFLPPKEFSEETQSIKGSLKGIGTQIGLREGELVIIAPLEDSPAERAGLLADDKILEINGESTKGIHIDAAADKIRGEKGTTVNLLIQRKGVPNKIYTIVRDEIEVKSVSCKPVMDTTVIPNDIQYIRLSSFISKNAATEIEEILSKMIITKDNNVFDINDWVLDDTSKLYELTVNDSDVTADSLVNVQILTNFLSIAEDAGVSNYSESFDGGFKIFSTSKPVSNIEYNYVINNPYLR